MSLSVCSNSGNASSGLPPARYASASALMVRQRVRIIGTEAGFHEPQRLLGQRQGQIHPPGIQIRRGQAGHASERAGMVGAELGFCVIGGLLGQRQGLVPLPGLAIRHGEVVHDGDCFGMVGA